MSRLTDHQDSEIVCEYYGINSRTYKVECVSETKGGVLSLMRGGDYITHPLDGKKGLDECGAVFDLVEIRPVRGSLIADQGHTDGIRPEFTASPMRCASASSLTLLGEAMEKVGREDNDPELEARGARLAGREPH